MSYYFLTILPYLHNQANLILKRSVMTKRNIAQTLNDFYKTQIEVKSNNLNLKEDLQLDHRKKESKLIMDFCKREIILEFVR